jgi:RNA polymerase sigma factor (sigma-70 family)
MIGESAGPDAGRRKLFGLAYRMLGSAADAEDVVQEALLRWHTQSRADVRNPEAFLTTVVTRLCLDHLKSARLRLETYPGVWLPEPLGEGEFDNVADASQPTPEENLQRLESVSLAFLAVLQALSPIERAVFLLAEIFDYSHSEIGKMIGRTPEACRQALHRSRQSLAASVPGDAPSESHRALLASFIRAVRRGDLEELMQLLTDDVESQARGRRAGCLALVCGFLTEDPEESGCSHRMPERMAHGLAGRWRNPAVGTASAIARRPHLPHRQHGQPREAGAGCEVFRLDDGASPACIGLSTTTASRMLPSRDRGSCSANIPY